MQLIATCAFGLEKLVYKELKQLGLWVHKNEDGRVTFEGTEEDIIRCNLWLRCAERVQIKLAEFEAQTFDELFDEVYGLDWLSILPEKATFPVLCSTTKSTLHNEPAIQSIGKKAIVKKLQTKYGERQIPETGPTYSILLRFNNNICTVSLDTTGDSLHKRGYRTEANLAPLKETMAAALVLLSEWKPDQPLIDPFCGSGTILIEAAMIALNMAPGMDRNFMFETWPGYESQTIESLREEARRQEKNYPLEIHGYDIDMASIRAAKDNVRRAGLSKNIQFEQIDFHGLPFEKFENITFITNPPYGERLSNLKEVEKLYYDLGDLFSRTTNCSLFLLTGFEQFESAFGTRATKNRKLYNGKIKCYYYQYPAANPTPHTN